jgi:hypothetical protein
MEKINEEYTSERNKSVNIDVKPNLDKINLDRFVMKYASDELESLKDIIFKDNEKRLQKYFWMYEQENKANEKLAQIKEYSEQYLALPNDPNKHFERSEIVLTENDAKNSLFFNPIYSKNALLANKRNRNEDKINDDDLSSGIKSDKEVIKENTRLPNNFIETMTHLQNQRMKKKLFESYESSDLVKLLKEIKNFDAKQKEEKKEIAPTPVIRGYKLMKEPEPVPGIIDPNPIFTWGEVSSTPNIISSSGNKFSVPQTPLRETIAHGLVTQINNKKNEEIEAGKNNL